MSLSWKDAVTTVLTAGSVTVTFAVVREWISFLSVRWSILGVIVIGLITCAIGGYNTENIPASYSILMGSLVVVACVSAVLGLVFGHKGYLISLAAAVTVLWLIATIRHAIV